MPNTINIGTTQALEFKLVGDHSSSTLSFSLYESSGGSALFTKSGTNITKIYNAPYTFIQVAILKGDTSGLTGGYKDYTISGTSGVLESGSIYCSPVTHNATDPLSQFDRLTTRIIALEADEFDNGDFLRVVETDGVKSFVNLTPAEVRTALDVAKIEAGSSTELYLKWNNTTSKWETRTLVEIQGDLGIEAGTSSKLFAKWDNDQSKWIARTQGEMQNDLGIEPGVWSNPILVEVGLPYTITISGGDYAKIQIKYQDENGDKGYYEICKVLSASDGMYVLFAGGTPHSATEIGDTGDGISISPDTANITITYKILYF